MEKFPRIKIPEQSPIRKSFQKLEIEDGERLPTFWGRVRHLLAGKKKSGLQEKKPAAKGRRE
ncbi:MAG: hypothetical protein NTV82_17460 [Candidatus Aminicenantes bacterium]|jgi:hypothetical protein|nr:hypothetical protein [Candidatus Aminicenantes bacterium]